MANWTGNAHIDALIVGSRLTNAPINYFLDPAGGAWAANEVAAFAAAAMSWSNVANVTFQAVGAAATAHFIERKSTQAALGGGGTVADHEQYPIYNSNPVTAVTIDLIVNTALIGRYATDVASWDANGLMVGGDGFVTIVHEIGHGLGLDHTHFGNPGDPHVFPGVAAASDAGTNGLNSTLYSIMSYRNGPMISGDTAYGRASGPMAFDIGAIQTIYGANTTFMNGNDTYTLPDTNAAGTFWTSIWDTGGTDAIVYNGTKDATIDLRPATLQNEPGGGGFASFATGITGGFTIAADITNALANVNSETGVVIENATGGTGNDTITGNGAHNIINGGAGIDTMAGGNGNDTYVVDNSFDVVTEIAGQGDDTINTSVDFNMPNFVERLNLTGTGDLRINGNNLANTITGNSGNNTINGGTGTDLMTGGAGNDTYAVDNSFDQIVELAGGGNDAVYSSQDIQLFGNVETLILTEAAVQGFGDNTANQIFGNGNVNVLFGQGGNDLLLGLGGDDIFVITPENGAFDVIGDFEGAGIVGGDRIGISGFGAGAQVYQVSTTSFQIRSADNSIMQQFILQNHPGWALDPGDYYFA